MTDEDRPAGSVAAGLAGLIATVVIVNVALRVVPLPDIDLPSIPRPDLPAWVGTALKVKNWALGGVVVVLLVCAALAEIDRRRRAP